MIQEVEKLERLDFLAYKLIIKWKRPIEYIIFKPSLVSFFARTDTALVKVNTLKLVFFVYFRCVMCYGIIFWGN
jgi:hypothetical protein